MGYQRKESQPGPLQSVEQARRVNAELRRELERLAIENAQLTPHVETLRLQVTAARKKLTRQIRELEAARIQAERLANVTEQASTLPEPIYGGRKGLEAAAAEIEAHEAKRTKTSTIHRPKKSGPVLDNPRRKHGTVGTYRAGCRCEPCKARKAEYKAQYTAATKAA